MILEFAPVKNELLSPDFELLVSHYDIVCLNETKLTDLDDYYFPNFKLTPPPKKK